MTPGQRRQWARWPPAQRQEHERRAIEAELSRARSARHRAERRAFARRAWAALTAGERASWSSLTPPARRALEQRALAAGKATREQEQTLERTRRIEKRHLTSMTSYERWVWDQLGERERAGGTVEARSARAALARTNPELEEDEYDAALDRERARRSAAAEAERRQAAANAEREAESEAERRRGAAEDEAERTRAEAEARAPEERSRDRRPASEDRGERDVCAPGGRCSGSLVCDVDTNRCINPDSEEPESDVARIGYLIGNTTPSANVWVDGRDTGRRTPIRRKAPIPIEAGKREVAFLVGDRIYRFTVIIEPGKTIKLIKRLK
jgi:hypothetical protein